MRRSLFPLGCAVLGALACHRPAADPLGSALPMVSAAAIVEGRANGVVPTDTVDAAMTIGLQRARWSLRADKTEKGDFWGDVSLLDTPSAERAATSMEERTFAAALRTLMDGTDRGGGGGVPDPARLGERLAGALPCARRPHDGAVVSLGLGGDGAAARRRRTTTARSPRSRSPRGWSAGRAR